MIDDVWLAKHWELRAAAELKVATYFSALLREVLATGAHPKVIEMLARAPADEVSHAKICLAMAEHYGAKNVAWPAPADAVLARPEGVSRAAAAAINLVAHCCINETIANAWLESCFAMAKEPAAREALRKLLADEIDHGRVGWAHLASEQLATETRQVIAACAASLIKANIAVWTRAEPDFPKGGAPDHGIPGHEETVAIVHAAVDDLVRPGFRKLRYAV